MIYDKLVEKALQLLVSQVVSHLEDGIGSASEEWVTSTSSFLRQLGKVHRYLVLLDRSKQALPKMSEVLQPLAKFTRDNQIRNDSAERLNTTSYCKTNSDYEAAYGSVIAEEYESRAEAVGGLDLRLNGRAQINKRAAFTVKKPATNDSGLKSAGQKGGRVLTLREGSILRNKFNTHIQKAKEYQNGIKITAWHQEQTSRQSRRIPI